MKKTAILALVSLIALSSQATAGQPEFVEATITPDVAAIGDTVSVTVEFTGEAEDMEKVYLTVREYPYDGPIIPLRPVGGDKNVWAVEDTVPYDAPAETFNLDITALDKEGKEIVTPGFEDNRYGKAGSVKIEVTY